MTHKTPKTTLRSAGKRVRLLLRALMNIGGLTATTGVLAWLILRENVPLSALFGALMPFTLLPSCLFVLVAVLLRAWRSSVLNLLPALVFLVLYSVYLLPRPPVAANGREITFATFNLHTAPDVKVGEIAAIREMNADVVALQEVSGETEDYIRAELADMYPYQVLYTSGMSVMGRGILSRYPLSNERLIISSGREIVLRADVSFDGNSPAFTVYSVHLEVPDWQRIVDYNTVARTNNRRDLETASAAETLPLVMMGDFNASDTSDDIAALNATYGEACRQRCQGLTLTFPATEHYPSPVNLAPSLIRLDYVFFDDHWQALSAEAWHTSGGSDHRPLRAVLSLNAE